MVNIKNKFFISQSPRMLGLRDKRANVWINLLVLLVVITCLAALLSFVASSGKIESEVSNSVVLEQVNLKENLVDFYAKEMVEEALVKTYKEFVEEEEYVGEPVIYDGTGNVEFVVLRADLKERFKNKFDENFKSEFSKYEFEEEYYQTLKNSVINGNFESSLDGNRLNLNIKNLEIKDSFVKVSVDYVFDSAIELDFKKIGLHSFEDVYGFKECVKKREVCSLDNFDMQIFEKNGEKLVALKSKRSFLIDGEFKKIEFKFVVK